MSCVKSRITRANGAGLGVIAAELNGDGWADLYLANDGNRNQLWVNQRDRTFKNEADIRGCAVNADGVTEAGVGVDIADFDGNGREDIFRHLTRDDNVGTRDIEQAARCFAPTRRAAGDDGRVARNRTAPS